MNLSAQPDPMPVRVRPGQNLRLGLIVLAGVTVLFLFALVRWRHPAPMVLHTCLVRADGLREGAPVTISGVHVGYVGKVRVQPENHSCPVAAEIGITVTYEVKIPADSVVKLSRTGILGETYLEIDAHHAGAARR